MAAEGSPRAGIRRISLSFEYGIPGLDSQDDIRYSNEADRNKVKFVHKSYAKIDLGACSEPDKERGTLTILVKDRHDGTFKPLTIDLAPQITAIKHKKRASLTQHTQNLHELLDTADARASGALVKQYTLLLGRYVSLHDGLKQAVNQDRILTPNEAPIHHNGFFANTERLLDQTSPASLITVDALSHTNMETISAVYHQTIHQMNHYKGDLKELLNLYGVLV